MARKPYPSDLTNAQWKLIARLIPATKPGGRPRKYDMREVVNAILYVNREGCTWRALPHDLTNALAAASLVLEAGLATAADVAEALATFRHPHIVRVARFFEANNTAYMVLEYERGESLKNWWRKHADTPEAELLGLFGPLLDG